MQSPLLQARSAGTYNRALKHARDVCRYNHHIRLTLARIDQQPERQNCPLQRHAGSQCSQPSQQNTQQTTAQHSALHEPPVSLNRRHMILASIMSACAFSSRAPAQAEQCQLQLSPSGLQYCDIQEGQGPEPIKGSFIK